MADATVTSLTTLLQNSSIDDNHVEILRAANNVLAKSKTDNQARHVKVVALLKLDRFDDALRMFDEAGNELKEVAKLEYAYTLYKVGKLEEAAQVASESDNAGLEHVLAQSSYRSEKFQDASVLYTNLSSESSEQDNSADLRINKLAVDAQLEWAGLGQLVTKRKSTREDLDSFETAYNAACGSVARGDLGQAEILLKRSKDLCNALEDLTDEEKLAETLPIVVQQIYVFIRQGKYEEASRLSSGLSISKIPDLSTRQLAEVNDLVINNEEKNPYLSHRIFHSSPSIPQKDKLFTYQSSQLLENAYVLDLLSRKYSGVSRSSLSYLSSHSSHPTSPEIAPISVLNAAANAQSQNPKATIKVLLPLLETRRRDAGLLLTILHLYLITNNHGSAVVLLESFFQRLEESGSVPDLDIRFAPGLIAAAVALYGRQGRKIQLKQELVKAAKYWRNKKSPDYTISKELPQAAGIVALEEERNTDIKEALEAFESIISNHPSDEAAKAGLTAAYAKLSPDRVTEEQLSLLPAAQRLVPDLNNLADGLETTGVPFLASAQLANALGKRKAISHHRLSKKKIRKSRTPQNYVEGKDVDKERWVPMRDRSYYRPKKRKGKGRADGGGMTQGGVATEDKVVVSGIEGKPIASSGGAANTGQGKKKKGKGKSGKW